MKFLQRLKLKYKPQLSIPSNQGPVHTASSTPEIVAQLPVLTDKAPAIKQKKSHQKKTTTQTKVTQQQSKADSNSTPTLLASQSNTEHDGSFLLIDNILYQLSFMAEGGKSTVFKASPTCRQHEPVTVKMINPQWLYHEGVKRQLCLETNIVRGLEHANLPTFVGRGQFAEQLYLAYRYIEGETLMSWLREHRFSALEKEKKLETVMSIASQIADQLCYLHTKTMPVVHGDLSAENIIISPDLAVSITDFSASHLLNTPTAVSYRWVAKPSYLTPEQARGDRWSWQSDMYQLGILLFEMISGCRWNKGASPREKMIFSASVKKPEDEFLLEASNKELSQLVAQLLEPNPEKRTISAAQCLKRLEQIKL